MKSALIIFCLLGTSFAISPRYRLDGDAPVPADPETPVASATEDSSLSIITVDSRGRVLKEEKITEDELKQIEEQLAKQKPLPVKSQARNPQNSESAIPQQAFVAYKQPFFGPSNNPFYRSAAVAAPVQSSDAVPVVAIPQATVPKVANAIPNAIPIATYNPQFNYKAQPVYILNPAAFEGAYPAYAGYGYQAYQPYPLQNPYRTFTISNYPTTISSGNGQAVVNPIGGIAICKFNIFTNRQECYGS